MWSFTVLAEREVEAEQVREGLNTLSTLSAQTGMILIVGAPVRQSGRLFNAAVVMSHGRICGVVPKTYLPNTQEFYEERWFSSAFDLVDDQLAWLEEAPPFVDPDLCISCAKCSEVCPEETPRAYDEGLTKRKAIDKEFERGVPDLYTILPGACTRCGDCVPVCPTQAINLVAMFNLTTGYFLSQRAMDSLGGGKLEDPDNIARQKRLLHKVIRAMLIS